ncbi:MAG: hypothetical protein QOJ12_2673, partial [Thermoleophilales bacterium]|nr:hypothetical protein [Thermoleophilales bacterium]
MCGIAGILGFTDSFAVGEELVCRMRDTLEHRGPDDAGAWHSPQGRVALGHRRLSIIDLSAAGHQPMCNEDGTIWITYNGEVYNHLALRTELESKGHVYRSRTDTETIIHLYEEEGERCVERLEGMFAFAIWDSRRRRLFLARDRLGVKPLCYAQVPGGFVFGSEIKAILEHPAISPDIDERAFFDYLTFAFVPPPRTMYDGISKLAPAERMTVEADGRVRSDIYWSPFSATVAADVAAMAPEERRRHLLDLLRISIRKRMMADVPFGVFLSGGVDSSINVALMAELMDQPVKTFSTSPRAHHAYDELDYARLVARRFETDHHEVLIDTEELEDFLPLLLYHQDEPLADWTAVPQHYVTKLARDAGVVVVQAGEGADELFHGYRGYATHRRFVAPFQRLPGAAQRLLAQGVVRATHRLGRGIRHAAVMHDAANSRLPYWGGSLSFRGQLKDELFAGSGQYASSYGAVERLWDETDNVDADLFQRMTYIELKQR